MKLRLVGIAIAMVPKKVKSKLLLACFDRMGMIVDVGLVTKGETP
ncbi:MAG: hypothetical protein O2954_08060 [bacterium]|nr:hypothetical protein [bacterium]